MDSIMQRKRMMAAETRRCAVSMLGYQFGLLSERRMRLGGCTGQPESVQLCFS